MGSKGLVPVAVVALLALSQVLALPSVPAQASRLKSSLTAIDTKACEHATAARSEAQGEAWHCRGLPGYPVYLVERARHQSVSFGIGPERRRSASQSLGAVNSIFLGKPDGDHRATVEWRGVLDANGDLRPFATIVRFHTEAGEQKGEVLVITKVSAGESCQLALVDALANEGAIAIARQWADDNARSHPCPERPLTVGRTGVSPM